MNKVSIKSKIIIWYTIIMIIVSILSLLIISSVSKEFVLREYDEKIIKVSNEVSRGVIRSDGTIGKMPETQSFKDGVHSAIFDGNYNKLDGFIPVEFDIDTKLDLIDNDLQKYQLNNGTYITYVNEIPIDSEKSLWLVSILSITNVTEPINNIFRTNLILTFVFLIAASVGGYCILTKAFKPVNQIIRTAKEISESNDLSQRIALKNGKDEIYKLANIFDEMLDKIEISFENEKQFTSDASHELRTPVSVIKTECEYNIKYVKTIEDAKKGFASIENQSDKMLNLILQLLTTSRMDNKTLKMNFENIDVSEILEIVCEEQEEIHDSSIKLTRNIPNDVMIRADQSLVTRTFINLISNAYTYGRDNGNIIVSLEGNQDHVIITVADDGIGIAKEHLSKIWERFYQVDKARTSDDENIGLGLSMVKWIVEHHHGTVSVESEYGKGSKFVVVLPRFNIEK